MSAPSWASWWAKSSTEGDRGFGNLNKLNLFGPKRLHVASKLSRRKHDGSKVPGHGGPGQPSPRRIIPVSQELCPSRRAETAGAGKQGAAREVRQTRNYPWISPVAAMQRVLSLAPPGNERRRTRSEIISRTGLGPRAKDGLASGDRCGVHHLSSALPNFALAIPKASESL